MATREKAERKFMLDKVTIELIIVAALIVGSLLVAMVIYATQFFPEDEGGRFFTDFHFILFGAGATIAAFFVSLKIYTYKTVNGLIWLSIALGNLFWTLGEFGWFYYEIVLRIETPYPSLADVLWISGYPFLYFALFKANQLIKTKLSKIILIIYAIIAALGVIVIFLLVMWPIAVYPVGEDFTMIEKAVSILYPTMDIFLLLFALLILLRFKGAKISLAWFILAISFLMEVIADTWFSYLEWLDLYYVYHPLDLFWDLGYALIVVAAYYLRYTSNRKLLMRL